MPIITRLVAAMMRTSTVPAELLTSYRDMMTGSIIKSMGDTAQAWAARQMYIAVGNFLTSAAWLGIDFCPMEGIEPGKCNEMLGLNKLGLSAIVVVSAGYRSTEDK